MTNDCLTHILLIDDDPIFRLGLCTALEAFPDLQIVAQADTGAAALEILGGNQPEKTVNLVVLELSINSLLPQSLSGLALCQQLKTAYPNLPILLLTSCWDTTQLIAARELGIEGFCPKGSAISVLVAAMRQVILRESSWQILPNSSPAAIASWAPKSWSNKVRSQGLRQIEDNLAIVRQHLQNPRLSTLDWMFWSGRRRELLAARWLVNQLLPTDIIVVEREKVIQEDRKTARPQNSLAQLSNPDSPIAETKIKLQSDLSNLTGFVLEIDILNLERKRNLLAIILIKFEEILEELRFSKVTYEQIKENKSRLLKDLWQLSLTEFLGKYYTLQIGDKKQEITDVLLQQSTIVQTAILDKIPGIVELLAQQLFQTPLIIDNVSYPVFTPEAKERAGILLQNCLIQVANAVIQPLLNEFADLEIIKQSFYNRSLISSREIAKFRNNLSWRYRKTQLLSEPQAIFESRYDLFFLSDNGIKKTSIYAPRRQELEQLRGIRLAVTLAYEARDAIAPRLQAATTWVGRGIVYILTQVLGRSIGLVLRGVIQGVGSAWQETRFGKNGDQGN
jgi:DNA-binding NarL/FixJ family response regulator